MPIITKPLITELIEELTALRSFLPDESEDPITSTINLKRTISKINDLNWALNHTYRHYPSFYKGPYRHPNFQPSQP